MQKLFIINPNLLRIIDKFHVKVLFLIKLNIVK